MFTKLPAELVTAPTATIMSLEDAKLHVRRDDNDDDTYISALIKAVQSRLDGSKGILGLMLIDQEWSETANGFPVSDCFELLLKPVTAINSIQYYDLDNSIQTFNSANYSFHNGITNAYVKLNSDASWPSTYDRDDATIVEYAGGYGAASTNLPEAISQAGKLILGHFYENRESVVIGTIATQLPMAVDALLQPFMRSKF